MSNKKITFAENLKQLRTARGYSRSHFGKMMSYSAKSIEKWEAGVSVPPLNVICDIADIFGVSLEALVFGSKNDGAKYFLGIDGGGTKTSFLLTDVSGKTVAECKLGPSNPCDIGIEECKHILSMGIQMVCHGVSTSATSVFAGISGVTEGETADSVKKFLKELNFYDIGVGNDIENVLELTLGGQNGVAVICGTGVNAFAQKNGERKSVAGHGYLFDNGGSGFDIGRDAFEAVYRELDGRGEKTVLTKLIGSQFDKPINQSIDKIYKGGKQYIASVSPLVFKAYAMGDRVAADIIERNANALSDIIVAALKIFGSEDVPVVVCGGVCNNSDVIMPIVKKQIPNIKDIRFTAEPTVWGAVGKARRLGK